VRVEWTMARVHLLAARSFQSYRCLALGHARAQCTAVKRGGACYRCGQVGHLAASCSAQPHCVVCARLGRPAEHRCGGPACRPPPKGKKVERGELHSPPVKETARVEVGAVSLPAGLGGDRPLPLQ